jgi:acyl carrier protein
MAVEQAAGVNEMMKELASYISEKVVKGKSEVTEDTSLVASGLVDSFAMIDIFLELQRITGRKISASKVQAKDMETIRTMFAIVEKFGKPPKS